MRYMVVVNRKYIVAVEANSACSAEHAILDNMDGVQGAQAFTGKELSTDTFQWYFKNGLTVSYCELAEIFSKYTEACKKWADAKAAVKDMKDKIEKMKKDLADAVDKLHELRAVSGSALINVQAVKEVINLKD